MNQLALYESKGNIVPLFDNKKLELLKSTICKGSTNDEFELFLHACQRTGLDPFMRQIYAVKRWDSNLKRESMTIQTGIDGYRLIAERTRKYAPGRESTYTYTPEGQLISSTAYVKKQTEDGTWHEIAATAFFNEYCQKTKEGKPTRFWLQMGHTMLSKCAEALALRRAFPGDLSGIYTKEEMEQAEVEEISNNHSSDIEKIVKKMPKIDHKPISKDQWESLHYLISQCSNEFQTKVWDKMACMGIADFPDITEDIFNKFKKSCEEHISKGSNATH